MKKLLSWIVSCTLCVAATLAAGCKQEPSSSQQPPVQMVERLEMEDTDVLLTLGDKQQLFVSYNELEGKTLSWTSSAPSIVSVDANGNVEGLQVGVATVTAHYGSKQVSCRVEVGLSGNLPTLAFSGSVGEGFTVVKGARFDLGASIHFNGKAFNDGEIEYFVADASVGAVENGTFVAGNEVGSTQVSVFATWRGQTVHAKTFSVSVVEESTVMLNNGMLTSVEVYMAAEHEGISYATSQTVSSVYISRDGEEIKDFTLSVLDENIASLEKTGDEWVIQAKKAGKTNLIVSYENGEYPFEISVIRPVKELNKTISYSLTEAKYFDANSETFRSISEAVDGLSDMVSYTFGEREYKLKNGALDVVEGEGYVSTFYNETVGYKVTLDVYTDILDELSDFTAIYAGDTEKDVTGSYMLGRDIIEPNTVLTMPSGKVPNNFAGTFDGKGHVLSFTFVHGNTHKFGLFGKFLKGATIKNLALNNITKGATAGANVAGIICFEGSDGAATTKDSTLENIYVDLKFSEKGSSNVAFMGNAMWATELNNVIIHVPEVPVTDTYGSFARGETISVSNSYVISSAPLYVTVSPTNFKKVPKLYADYATMKADGNDYSSFSEEFWDTTTYGVPVWKSLVDSFTME